MVKPKRLNIPKRGIRPEWTDRRIVLYTVLSFSIVVNIYGAVAYPEISDTSLLAKICLSSLETISLMFGGYVLGRVAERHSALRRKDDVDELDSSEESTSGNPRVDQ